MAAEHTIRFRVRYAEVDQMGVVHHSMYLTWFEMGRVELMRAVGLNHRRQEDLGRPLSLRDVEVRYQAPARYDDELELVTTTEARGARVVFTGRLKRVDPEPLAPIATAEMTGAAITPGGRIRRLSDEELAAFNGLADE